MRWQFPRRPALALPMLVLGIAALLAGCEQEQKEVVPEVRPVRTITARVRCSGISSNR